MADVHASQIIANDNSEIASKFGTLISDFDIDSTELLFTNVVHFGSNRFLILAIYAGPFGYLFKAAAGLIAKLAPYGFGKAPLKPKVGFLVSVAKVHNP